MKKLDEKKAKELILIMLIIVIALTILGLKTWKTNSNYDPFPFAYRSSENFIL